MRIVRREALHESSPRRTPGRVWIPAFAGTTESERAVSLLDTLIGLAMAVFITSVLGTFILFQNRKLGAETRAVSAQQDLRATLELLASDLRSAGRRAPGVSYASAASPPGLCTREADRVRMTADLDGDGTTLGSDEDVTYCLCPGSGPRSVYRAYRPSGSGSFVVEPLAREVAAFQLTYSPRRVSASMTVSVSTPLGSFSEGAGTAAELRNAADVVSCAAGPACPPAECS